VDGTRCEATGSLPGVTGVGAIRSGEALRIWNLPSSQITTVEATPGFSGLVAQVGASVQIDPTVTQGVWVSSDLADAIGASPGGVIQTSQGPAQVAGVYTWPDDGRARDLGYTIVVPVPATGVFSQCWAQIWPPDQNLASVLYTSVNGAVDPRDVSMGQLNTSRGATYDALALLANRLTARAPWIGAVIGMVVGYVAVRLRRVEIASSLHARVSHTYLGWQHLVETLIWAGSGIVIAAAGLLWFARLDNPDPSWAVWLIGLRTLTAGGAATLVSTLIAIMTTREKHLFLYTKDR